MPLSKKDKQEVAAMVARAIAATGGVVDSQAVETAAQDPEMGAMRAVERQEVITVLDSVAGVPQPDAGNATYVHLRGLTNGEVQPVAFVFPPGDPEYLSELKRVQSYPHLLQNLVLIFREPAEGPRYITRLCVACWAP